MALVSAGKILLIVAFSALMPSSGVAPQSGRNRTALPALTWLKITDPDRRSLTEMTGSAAAAARDAFDILWHDHLAVARLAPESAAIERAVPPELVRFLPFRALNPAQAEALPHVFGHDENLLVVAPTGAGKTVVVVVMAAALRTVVQQGCKSAWLVPQRSLTDGLDRELAGWRSHGLRVERLSGEQTVGIARIRGTDLWVATTEKFEAICRASAFRVALAEVGSLVVDEIHTLPEGGPATGAQWSAVCTCPGCLIPSGLPRLRAGRPGALSRSPAQRR
jgi:DEAD/DEAH box helicase